MGLEVKLACKCLQNWEPVMHRVKLRKFQFTHVGAIRFCSEIALEEKSSGLV